VSGQGLRSSRVSSRVREELAALLREMSDPRIAGVLISRVEMTDDLSTAKVFVRHELSASLDAAGRRAMLAGLEAASGRLRREVAQALSLRRAPSLRFLYDEGQDSAYRVEELLREIRSEDERQGKG
jgi:ribosome-binding factor A